MGRTATKEKLIGVRGLSAIATRQQILKAAIEVFSTYGYEGGSTEKISKLAKSHDRMIYYYFGSKQGLYIAAIQEIYKRFNEAEAKIKLNIETGKPGVLIGELGTGLENLLKNIKKLLPIDRQLTINVFEIEQVDLNAGLLGDLVVDQLEKRVAFRRAIREALQRAQTVSYTHLTLPTNREV